MKKLDLPKIGKVYRHYKGNYYTVIAVALDCENPDRKLVVYQDLNGKAWAREIDDFMAILGDKKEGTYFYRFEPVK